MIFHYLTAILADDASLWALERPGSSPVGAVLADIFRYYAGANLGDMEKSRPLPRPVVVNGRKIGFFLGFHGQYRPTGTIYARAPLAPGPSVVFTTTDEYADTVRIPHLEGQGIAIMIRSLREGASLMDAKLAAGVKDPAYTALVPVLYNDTFGPAFVRALRTKAFRPGEEKSIQSCAGRPICFPPDFKPLERVSELPRPEPPTKRHGTPEPQELTY